MSSVFTQRNHLFGRNPRGGITDFELMAEAGFGILLANVGDFDPSEWQEHRDGCARVGMLCCPWLRTADANGVWDDGKLIRLIDIADDWCTPLVVNSESELDQSGATLTSLIAERVGDRDAALSSLAWPMNSVDWTPVANLPALPQLFTAEGGSAVQDPDGCIWQWHERGVCCVVPTLGSYGGQGPDTIPNLRCSPFGVYTADDMGQDYASWCAYGTHEPCWDGGEDVTIIGTQHGITAAVNRMRTLDPKGTLLVQGTDGKWPPLNAIEDVPIDKWKAYDKLERTLSILREDHDAAA